jgi:hypothetical protein
VAAGIVAGRGFDRRGGLFRAGFEQLIHVRTALPFPGGGRK